MDSQNKLAKENYTLIQVDRSLNKGYKAHMAKDYTDARHLYLKILALKNNHWARENLKELP
ncbi:MAG: hypothetical protein R2779_11095 [Crocinitomicaceae bacterium]